MKLACYFVVFSLMVYASGSMKTGIANEISTENRKGNRIKYMMLDSVKGSVMETTNKAGETTPLLKALQYTKNMYDYYEHFQKLKDVIIFKYFLFTSALRFMRYCPEIWDQANQLANNFHNWEEVRSRGLSIFSYIFYENILPDLPSIENIIPTILTILGVNQQILPKSYHNIGPSIVQLKSLLSKMYNKTRYGDANTEFSEMKNILPIGLDLLYNGYDCAPDIAIAIIKNWILIIYI